MVAFPVPVGGLRKAPTELLGRKEVSGRPWRGMFSELPPTEQGVGCLSVFSRAPESSTTLRDSCIGARARLDRNTEGTDFGGTWHYLVMSYQRLTRLWFCGPYLLLRREQF